MACVIMISCVIVAPGVKKTGGSDLMEPTPFYYCRVTKGAFGAEVAVVCGPKARRCGDVSPAVVVIAAFVVGSTRAVKPAVVPTGVVIIICWSEIDGGATSFVASSKVG